MNLYSIDGMVQERIEELHRLSRLDAGARRSAVPGWRRRVGRRLAGLAVAVGVPPSQRPASRARINAALCLDPPSPSSPGT
jgi:hypothetical protein